ncbi:LAMI_0A03026g1_1 [Lachancea mirantina]|uniref:1-acyl-sn-glycerol-3-phosphate acyltransferase n=1 Tax=Lachancea mirantina TaxID=1230905 RepID=A0A1G4IN21_9SACH|nr:LAMI_0A03026g1_1 [Lachancea mirantina]
MGVWQKILFYFKATLAVTVLSACALYGVIASVILTCIGQQRLAQWTTARSFYHVVGAVLGIDVRVINAENLEKLPAIFVSNHQSALDILMLGRTFPQGCTVTAKKSLKWVPFLGWFMALSGTLFLDRGNREKSVRTLNKALRQLHSEKRGLWIFPEGTRSHSSKICLLPFKKGAFHLAQQGKIPIIPVAVSNTSTLLSSKYKVFNRGVITVKVLDPIPTADLKPEDVGALTNKVRDLLQKEIEQLGYSEAIVDTDLPPEAKSVLTSSSEVSDVSDAEQDDSTSSKDTVEEVVETLEHEEEDGEQAEDRDVAEAE